MSANNIAKQVLDMPGTAVSAGAAGFFPAPPGFQRIDAVWSALSATPGPLPVRVEGEKEDNEWF
jgi:hypothetical protein